MDPKPFWQSKTLLANFLMMLLDILNGAFGAVPISPEIKVWAVLLVNVAVRVFTGTPLTVSKPTDPPEGVAK